MVQTHTHTNTNTHTHTQTNTHTQTHKPVCEEEEEDTKCYAITAYPQTEASAKRPVILIKKNMHIDRCSNACGRHVTLTEGEKKLKHRSACTEM
jgi:hypothetical protein